MKNENSKMFIHKENFDTLLNLLKIFVISEWDLLLYSGYSNLMHTTCKQLL